MGVKSHKIYKIESQKGLAYQREQVRGGVIQVSCLVAAWPGVRRGDEEGQYVAG